MIDSNVLFSALLRDSVTRHLLLNYNHVYLYPEKITEELEKYWHYLLAKSGLTSLEFRKILSSILNNVQLIPNSILEAYKYEANSIIGKIDMDDILFIACALAYPDSVLWSDDKRLKKQSKVKVLNTDEIRTILR